MKNPFDKMIAQIPGVVQFHIVEEEEPLTVEICSQLLDQEILIALGVTKKEQSKRFVYHPWTRTYRILIDDKIRWSCEDIHLRGLMESFNKL